GLLTVASFRTWRGSKVPFAQGPAPFLFFQACLLTMAERVGFEPTVQLPGQRFSRPPDSATLAPLHVLTRPPQAIRPVATMSNGYPDAPLPVLTPGPPRRTLFPWLAGPENRELTGNDSAV